MSKFSLQNLKGEVYGSSHADKIGIILKGVPYGTAISLEYLQNFVSLRKANNSVYSTKRIEEDKIEVLKGIENGIVTGDIECIIYNKNVKKNDYSNIANTPRPSHADYTGRVKYGDSYDLSGGGAFSGRMTACYCILGGIAKEQLEKRGIVIKGYISQIGDIIGKSYKDINFDIQELNNISYPFPVLDEKCKKEMLDKIAKASSFGDSVGGKIECVALNLPVGLGGEMFDGIEGELSKLLFSIPAVKGVEFGSGFNLSCMLGSFANDQMYTDGSRVLTYTNHSGGILGGITNGMPLTLSVAIKPTPSISIKQKSVNLKNMENVEIEVKGRHDPCIVPRGVPVVESMAALYLYDLILGEENNGFK